MKMKNDFVVKCNADELKKLYKRLNIDKNDLPLTFDVFERKLIYYGDRQVMDRANGPKHGW